MSSQINLMQMILKSPDHSVEALTFLDVYRSVTHARCRSQCSQCCRQYRYHHLYNRFPCILFHDVIFFG